MPPFLDPLFLLELIRAFNIRRTRLQPIEKASRRDVVAVQRRKLADILAHAARHSEFYRRLWGSRSPTPENFTRLPPTNKSALLVDGFDSALTVGNLSQKAACDILNQKKRRQRGKYLAVTTSGSTGEPAVMAYSRQEWREGMALVLRSADMAVAGVFGGKVGMLRALRERPRVAGIATLNPMHISSQLTASFHAGLTPSLVLSSSSPAGRQIDELNRFKPMVLGGYPSALHPMATAAEEGKLKITPKLVFSSGETVTPGLRRLVRRVWGVDMFDSYGLTETMIIASECKAHHGMHVYEDAAILEVVDDRGEPLPPGEKGAGILVTSLVNRTLPVIRYAVSDIVAVTEEPCPCGSPFRRITSIEGRVEETLALRGIHGETVSIHPFAIETPLEEIEGVKQFTIIPEADGGMRVEIVPKAGQSDTLATKVVLAVKSALVPLGVDENAVRASLVDHLDSRRGSTGKLLRK
jgi:phenylacetate-CoA ligase